MRTRGTSLVRQLEKHRQQFQESLGFSCTLPATGWQWPLRGQTLLVNPSELGSVSSFKTTRFSYYDWTIYQFHPKWWNPNISIILHHVTMFNFKSNSWLDRFESQNSATVQAQAGLEIEVVDFSPGGVGHRKNWETGRFLSLGTPRAGWFISNSKKHGWLGVWLGVRTMT